ncbi:mechanosensitive ion channel [Qipengyuania sp. CAU 1752]
MRIGNYRFDQSLAMEIGEKLFLAAVILLVTWALAKAAKWAFAKLVDNVSFFKRNTGSDTSLGEALGKVVSLLIWLFGLLAILQILGLGTVAGPVDTLLKNVVEFIPRIVAAGLIFFIGLMVARIVRDLITTALGTVNFDSWANRGGVDDVTGNSTISKTIATIVYVVIVLLVSIAALEALNIKTISDPASGMLRMIFAAIPNILAAAILLGIGYLISKFVAQMLSEILPGLGVDRALSGSGLMAEGTSASNIIARVVQVAIVLFFAIAATRLLGFPELTVILDEILELGGRVVFGAIIIAAGFMIANVLARIISGDGGETTPAVIVKWITMVLFVFMGINFMGIGGMIPTNILTILIAGVAVAGALAFGLGGREWAGRKLEEMDSAARGSAPVNKGPLPPGA